MLPRCPIQTRTLPPELRYAGADEEVRAYKLGKRRWSYNQVEVVLQEEGGPRGLRVCQAISQSSDSLDPLYRDSAVVYRLELSNGASVLLHGFLCYDIGPGGRPDTRRAGGGRGAGAAAATPLAAAERGLQVWHLVRREECCKGCTGPVVRVIQRFGKMGKRTAGSGSGGSPAGRAGAPPRLRATGAGASSPTSPSHEFQGGMLGAGLKDPRHMYLSFDEAGTHVGAKSFRLIVALLDAADGYRLLGSASSPPIRVLANNDVPTGAAHIRLQVLVDAAWPGWAGAGRLGPTDVAVPSPGLGTGLTRPFGGGSAATMAPHHSFDHAQQQQQQQQQQRRFGTKAGGLRPGDDEAAWAAGLGMQLGNATPGATGEPYEHLIGGGGDATGGTHPILSIGAGAWTGDIATPKADLVLRTTALDSPGHGSQTSSGSGLGHGAVGGGSGTTGGGVHHHHHHGLAAVAPRRPRLDWAPSAGREGGAWAGPGEHLGAHYPSAGRGWAGGGEPGGGYELHHGTSGGLDEDVADPESARSVHLRRRVDVGGGGSASVSASGGFAATAPQSTDERWIWEDVLRTFRSVPGLGGDAAAAAAAAAAVAAGSGTGGRGGGWAGAGHVSVPGQQGDVHTRPTSYVAQHQSLHHHHHHDLGPVSGVPLLGPSGGGGGYDDLGADTAPRVLQGFVLGEARGTGLAGGLLLQSQQRYARGAAPVSRMDSGLEELAEAMLGDVGVLTGLEGLGAGDFMYPAVGGGGGGGATGPYVPQQLSGGLSAAARPGPGSATSQPATTGAPAVLHPQARRQPLQGGGGPTMTHQSLQGGGGTTVPLHPPAVLEALQYLESLPGSGLGLGGVGDATAPTHGRGHTPPPLRMPARNTVGPAGVAPGAAMATISAAGTSPATPATLSPRSARVPADDGLVFTPLHTRGSGPAAVAAGGVPVGIEVPRPPATAALQTNTPAAA